MNEKERFLDLLERFIKAFNNIGNKCRQYRSLIDEEYIKNSRFDDGDDWQRKIVSFTMRKVWNHGMGSLETWGVDLINKRIRINLSLFNKADCKHFYELADSCPELKSFDVEWVYYGYPTYYNHGFFSSKLPLGRGDYHLW